jgi:hypothetical protein
VSVRAAFLLAPMCLSGHIAGWRGDDASCVGAGSVRLDRLRARQHVRLRSRGGVCGCRRCGASRGDGPEGPARQFVRPPDVQRLLRLSESVCGRDGRRRVWDRWVNLPRLRGQRPPDLRRGRVLPKPRGELFANLVDLAFPERVCGSRASVHTAMRAVLGVLLSRHVFGVRDGSERLPALQLHARHPIRMVGHAMKRCATRNARQPRSYDSLSPCAKVPL